MSSQPVAQGAVDGQSRLALGRRDVVASTGPTIAGMVPTNCIKNIFHSGS